MVASLSTLAMIIEEIEIDDPMLKTMKPFLIKLNRALAALHGTKGDLGISHGLKVEDYDADTEGLDDAKHGKKYAFTFFVSDQEFHLCGHTVYLGEYGTLTK